jgi:predicted Zn-dependent protease with MMP-like domain
MTILFVGEYDYIYIRKSTHQLDLLNYLHKKIPGSIFLHTNNWHVMMHFMKPTIVYIVACDTPRHSLHIIDYYKSLKVPVCLLCDDIFHFDQFVNNVYLNKCDAIISMIKMDRLLEQYRTIFPNKFISSLDNLFINSDKFKPQDIEKIYDITIYGSTENVHITNLNVVDSLYWSTKSEVPKTAYFYPFRKRVSALLRKNTHKYKINHIKPASSWEATVTGENLSKEISKSYIALATRSRCDKCMQKYLEIFCSGSVVVGDIPTDYQDFFDGSIIEINENMTDDEILAVIDKSLEDKKNLLEVGKKFSMKAIKNCGLNNANVVREFLDINTKILEKYTHTSV